MSSAAAGRVAVEVEEPELVEPVGLSEDQLLANLIRETVNGDQKAHPYPVPYISELTQTGKVTISFTRALKLISPQIDLKTLTYEKEPGVWEPVL